MKVSDKRFSILIPSWNNLPYLQLCVRSIRTNSRYPHQIIVHVNDGSDGTLEWVRAENLDYTHSWENLGVCLAMNSMCRLVQTDYIFYLNDDMYLLPGWAEVLMHEVESLPDNRFFLSGTMIQPHNTLDVGFLCNYGDSVDNFREDELLRSYRNFQMNDWKGATWPPNLVHRDIWDLVGGYSIEFSPGMYSDPDFTAKLWKAGVRYMKGLSACRVYHFETKSTGRIVKNNSSLQFLLKWGISNSVFRCKYSHLGQPFDAEESQAEESQPSRIDLLRCRLKAAWQLLAGKHFRPF